MTLRGLSFEPLGAAFLYGEAAEYTAMIGRLHMPPHSDLFSSTFFALTGFHCSPPPSTIATVYREV